MKMIINGEERECSPLELEELVSAQEIASSAPAPVPMSISDRQFFQQLAIDGLITQAEAIAAVSIGEIPAGMQVLIDQLPNGLKFGATMMVSGATEFRRDHDLTETIGQLYDLNPAGIDKLWRDASLL